MEFDKFSIPNGVVTVVGFVVIAYWMDLGHAFAFLAGCMVWAVRVSKS